MDYQKRTDTLLKQLEPEEVDWFIVTNISNVRYLSGFTGSSAMLLLGKEGCYILTDGRYQEQVAREVPHYEPIIQGKRKPWVAVKEFLGDLSSAFIWFESFHCSFARYEEMCETLDAKEYIGKKNIVENLRARKDEDEIALISKALRIAERAFINALDNIQEGITERELAHLIEHEMWKAGAQKESFESLVLFGSRSSYCHGKPTDKRLKSGDVVLMDFGCVVDGYCSDITRTVFLGEPDEQFKAIYQHVLHANQTATRNIKAGTHGKDADAFARDIIKSAGYEEKFVHGLGHGVGLEVHEAPRLSYLAETSLESGNVVTIEPGIYLEGMGGIRIENMVVICEEGCEILNQAPTDCIVL